MLQTTKSFYLTDLSPRDRPLEKRKRQAERFSALYLGTSYHKYGERVRDCGRRLAFRVSIPDNKRKRYKLRTARFCRVPRCPQCQGRRALRWNAKAQQIMPKVLADSPKSRFITLCFTVRNCPLVDLRSQLGQMHHAWTKLVKRKEFKAHGWVRTTEVTRGDDDTVHPHYHALLMVSSSYFGSNYITHERWRELWQDCLKVSYLPQVNVQAVKPKKGTLKGSEMDAVISATVEVIKYAVKPDDCLIDDHDLQRPGQRVRMSNQDWLVGLTEQLHKSRLIATGGVLKDYFKELEDERQEERGSLVHIREKLVADCESDEPEEVFNWHPEIQRYAM